MSEKELSPQTKEKIIELLAQAEYSLSLVKDIVKKLEKKKKAKKKQVKS